MPNTTFIHHSTSAALHRHSGGFLGCSLDFWTLLAVNVIGVPLCAAVIHTWVSFVCSRNEPAPEDSDDSDEEAKELLGIPPLQPAPASPSSLQQALSKVSHNDSASYNMDLAMRGTVAAAFCALTFHCAWLSWWQNGGWSMSYVVVMLAFTLYKDVGSTTQLAWSGFYGTALAVLNCYILYSIYPSGTTKEESFWSTPRVVGWANLVGTVLVCIAGNFHTNAKMFYLSWQAYYSMCFLNPNDDAIFSKSIFHLNLYGEDTSALTGTILGCVFALLCSLFPSCLAALRQAQNKVVSIAWEQGVIWQRLLAHCTDKPGTLERELLRSELRALREKSGTLAGLLASGWWECFDIGRTGAMRARMGKVDQSLAKCQEWLEGAWFAVEKTDAAKVNGEGGPASQLLTSIAPEMSQLQEVSWTLLCAIARAAATCEEELTTEQEDEIRRLASAEKIAQARLAATLTAKRAQLVGGSILTDETIAGQAFAFGLSSWSQTVANLASEFLDDGGLEDAELHPPVKSFCEGLVGLIVPYSDMTKKYVLHTVKLALTFALVFFLGKWGVWARTRWVVPNYNATPPGTVAYLIFSSSEAAALKKNSDRLMGVSTGMLVGQLMFVILCDLADEYLDYHWLVISFGMGVFCIVELCSFFLYFNSVQYSYTGLLVAAFFAEHCLQSCSELDSGTQDRSNYQNLLGQFAAILAATLVDVCTDTSQSLGAISYLRTFSDDYKVSLKQLSPPADGESSVAAMGAAGDAAAHEPRGLKPAWREGLWGKVYMGCRQLLRLIGVLSMAVGADGASKMVTPQINKLLSNLSARSSRSLECAAELLRYDGVNGEPPNSESLQMILGAREERTIGIAEAMAQVNTALPREQGKPADSLADDECCAIAAALAAIEATHSVVQQLERAVLDEPDLREYALS